MKILFDNGTPRGLAPFLTGHSVEEVRAHGWEELENGELIEAAEEAGFELIVTTDKNIRYQQNLKARKIALVVLAHSQWPMVKLVTDLGPDGGHAGGEVVVTGTPEQIATCKASHTGRFLKAHLGV